jgi:glycerol-3-phosphate dehydrogenase (NAD(P)+)
MQMQTERACFGVSFSDNLIIETNLENAVRDITDICLVIPSHAFRKVLVQLKSMVSPQVRFVWGTKGLDPETQGFLHDAVFEIFSDKTPVAALSGPSFAKEVAMNLPTAVSLAGNNPAFLDSLVQRFHNNHFRVYINSDLIGLQLCAVVKNVMAIAVGISDGMGFGTNTKCALITRGLAEMARLCEKLGGRRETTMSLAGVGDLVLTCTDNQSRNRRFGLSVGKGSSAQNALTEIGESVEGYYNAKQLFLLAQKNKVSMPISEQVYAILYENVSADHVLSELLARESTVE